MRNDVSRHQSLYHSFFNFAIGLVNFYQIYQDELKKCGFISVFRHFFINFHYIFEFTCTYASFFSARYVQLLDTGEKIMYNIRD